MDAKTTPEYLISNALNMPDNDALSWKDSSGNWIRSSWSDFYNCTMKMAKSLIALGLNREITSASTRTTEWNGMRLMRTR